MLTEGVITDNLSDISVGEMVSLQVRIEKTSDQSEDLQELQIPPVRVRVSVTRQSVQSSLKYLIIKSCTFQKSGTKNVILTLFKRIKSQ